MNSDYDPQRLILQAIVLFFGIGLHEYAHCKFADLAGDPTPRYYGRVTLNLTKQFELSGVIMMVLTSLVGYGFGWGKSSPMDSRKMRNPRWDFFIAVIAGPISNLLQALVYAAVFRMFVINAGFFGGGLGETVFYLCIYGVIINIGLAVFNMIPFGPLDGHWLLGLLLPENLRGRWFLFNRKIGFMGLFAVVLVLQAAKISIVGGPVLRIASSLLGLRL